MGRGRWADPQFGQSADSEGHGSVGVQGMPRLRRTSCRESVGHNFLLGRACDLLSSPLQSFVVVSHPAPPKGTARVPGRARARGPPWQPERPAAPHTRCTQAGGDQASDYGLSRAQAHHGDAAHLSLDPQPRQGPHRDLLRCFCPAALPAQHHGCGPRATQRGPYPDRAERRASLPHYRHQYAEAVSACLPRHRSSADALQRSRTKVPQQDPRAGRPRPAPLRSPATIERSLKGSLIIGTRSVQYCMMVKYYSYYFAPIPRKSRLGLQAMPPRRDKANRSARGCRSQPSWKHGVSSRPQVRHLTMK